MLRIVWALFCFIICVVAGTGQAGALGSSTAAFIDLCRQKFPDVAANPSNAGGWLSGSVNGQRALCLYGTLADVDISQFEQLTSSATFDAAILRSAGGPVVTWLSIAEALEGRIETVVVDEACFSSCANYLFPLGKETVTSANSLVVWHGGPTLSARLGSSTQIHTIERVLDYSQLATRTEALYARLGIDVRILRESAMPPPARRLKAALAGAPGRHPVSGYAFSPDHLSHCYRFSNLSGMWHAGDDAAVGALARARSQTLVVLESPFLPERGCK